MLGITTKHLPKSKTKAQLAEHYDRIEAVPLEKVDLPAMLMAAFISVALPIALMLTVLYGTIYLLFIR